MTLTVIGTVAIDSVESPFGRLDEGLGGSATHFSAAASFFVPIDLVAVIGEDFALEQLDFLRERRVNLSGLQRLPGKSFHWRGRYDYDLNTAHTLETQLNVLTQFDPRLPPQSRANPFVFLANIDPQLQLKVLDQLEGRPFVAADTMNFWIEGAREALLKLLRRIDMLVINEGEARLLAQEKNLLKASRIIRDLGPKLLLIKQGEYGALAFSEEKIFKVPALPLEDIQDPTGAGDAFAGGVMGYLAQEGSFNFPRLKRAMLYGTTLASFNVERFSCDRLKSLTHGEIEARYRELVGLSVVEELD